MKLESNTTNKVKLNCIITYIQMKRLKLNDRATSGINRRGATAHPCLRRLVLFDSWTKTASKANIHQHSLHTLAQRVGPTCSANVWRSLKNLWNTLSLIWYFCVLIALLLLAFLSMFSCCSVIWAQITEYCNKMTVTLAVTNDTEIVVLFVTQDNFILET